MEIKMTPLDGMDVTGKRVLLRLDINSPIDPQTKKIVNENRLKKSMPTLRYLVEGGAKVAIIAHQGDTLDYQNLIPLREHAEKLTALLGREVRYIDDVCGPAACEAVRALGEGECILLGNLRYLCEEVSGFEKEVKLKPSEMLDTWLVRTLAPLFDLYVNDAFSAAHRNCPSMTAFQEVLPTAAGFLLFDEYRALYQVLHGARKPAVFVLGGAKISDAFGMMEAVCANGTADQILTCGVTGQVMLLAKGVQLGKTTEDFLKARDLWCFVEQAKDLLRRFPEVFQLPQDLAFEREGKRAEIDVEALPVEASFCDLGAKTIAAYGERIAQAGTIFANGPAGVYENPLFETGTREIWNAVANAPGYSVIGGGDTVSSATRLADIAKVDYVCTAGGAMVRFMSGKKLALVAAMEGAYERANCF